MYRYQDRLRICEAFGDGQSTFPRVVLETDHVQDSTGHAYMIHNLDQPGMWPVWNEFSMSMWFEVQLTFAISSSPSPMTLPTVPPVVAPPRTWHFTRRP